MCVGGCADRGSRRRAGPGDPIVLLLIAGAADSTSCVAASPAAARIADVSLPCPCPMTTPTAVTGRPPTVTLVKKARHPPAAESDPVLPPYPSAIRGLKFVTAPATGSVTLTIETISR